MAPMWSCLLSNAPKGGGRILSASPCTLSLILCDSASPECTSPKLTKHELMKLTQMRGQMISKTTTTFQLREVTQKTFEWHKRYRQWINYFADPQWLNELKSSWPECNVFLVSVLGCLDRLYINGIYYCSKRKTDLLWEKLKVSR